ncbi:MAG: diguanylate cyclase [Proteobacteria bacterium]|nr:diguanylate cyclase [Pseudomonadota bacterium]
MTDAKKPTTENIQITDIFELEQLKDLTRDFSKRFGFCAFILDSKGQTVIEKTFVPEYCKKILSEQKNVIKCLKDTKKRMVLNKLVKKCWAKYRKIVVPIKFFDKKIGFWVTCGVPFDVDEKIVFAIANLIENFINNFMKTYENWWLEREKIIKVLNSLISQQDYDTLLEKIVSAATELLKTDRTTLFIFDGEKLVSKVAQGLDKEITLPLGDGIAGQCAIDRKIVVIDKITEKTKISKIVKDYEVKNLICAPVIYKRKLLGVIESFNKQSSFTAKDRHLFSYLADATAIALNNVQSFMALERLSIIDPLTQLYNRNFFVKNLEKEIMRLNRYGGSLAIMFIDLDDFKKLNDTYGHTVGDIILKEFANLIKNSLRDIDIAARFGGEEFVIMLPNTEKEGAYATAKRLQDKIINTPLAGHKVSASIGIATYYKGLTAKSLIERADKAMYRVKKTQKGSIIFWG